MGGCLGGRVRVFQWALSGCVPRLVAAIGLLVSPLRSVGGGMRSPSAGVGLPSTLHQVAADRCHLIAPVGRGAEVGKGRMRSEKFASGY